MERENETMSFSDWVLDLPVQVALWGIAAICLIMWIIAFAVLLIFLRLYH